MNQNATATAQADTAKRHRLLAGRRADRRRQPGVPHRAQVDLPTSASAAGTASEMLVGRNGRLLGSLHIEDALRPEAVEAVAALRAMGLRTVLLTGDTEDIAQAVVSLHTPNRRSLLR